MLLALVTAQSDKLLLGKRVGEPGVERQILRVVKLDSSCKQLRTRTANTIIGVLIIPHLAAYHPPPHLERL